ncbi:hypothetical protein J4416_04910 [Candidatus Pacearchaeota archaeon]|nr:hypothetical protein [Candidatus Pacearchaeota archaeon]
MGLQRYARWVDAPGSTTIFKEGRAGILQLEAKRIFSPDHIFNLLIAKTMLYEGCDLSSKLLPLFVGMWDDKKNERRNDFYSFDNNGICLSHGYSITRNGERIVDEAHDTKVDRLVEYGRVIKELIGEYPLPAQLSTHTTVNDLMNNSLRK